MNILTDSLSVLISHWQLVTGNLLILLVGQIWVGSALRPVFRDKLTQAEYYSLGLAGWMSPIFVVSVLWLLWRSLQRLEISTLIILILVAIIGMILFQQTRAASLQTSNLILFLLLVIFGVCVFLRLAFVSKTTVPLYFDSAQHYLIIKNLVLNPASLWQQSTYYHIGFHSVAALISTALQADTSSTMLILGQIILAVIPLSVFFLVRHETQSDCAGILAVLLSAFGWYMPAHAVDWGKYPALTSLALIIFVLSLAYLLIRHRNTLSTRNSFILSVMVLVVVGISVLTHSRSLVIFGIVALAWLFATVWQTLPKLAQWIVFGIVIIGLGVEIQFIKARPVLGPLFDPYLNKGLLITAIVLFLSIFAEWGFPKLAFATMLTVLLLFGSLFIPVSGIPGYIDLTLLDRPFVEMILFFPLSLLGGLGLAGLERRLQMPMARMASAARFGKKYIILFFAAIILINAGFTYEVYPTCCTIVGSDDLMAMDWIDKNLPAEARILTSSTELRVLATDSFQGSAGGDAGAWINPLTGRTTLPLPFFSDFGQQTTLDTLCNMQVNYIYVGETGSTFDDTKIAPHPDWYRALLSMPKVKVYQVIGCG